MEEVELKDYLKIIVRQKRLIIFTITIFMAGNLITGLLFKKPNFKASARLMLSDCTLKVREIALERYKSYGVISQVKDELNLKYLPQAPDTEIDSNGILRITTLNSNPKHAVSICNAFLYIIAKEEKQKYEKTRNEFQQQIQIIEEEVRAARKQLDNIDNNMLVYFYPQRIDPLQFRLEELRLDVRLDELRSELKLCYEKLNSLIDTEPVIITPALNAELIGVSRIMGVILSGFIGLVIGIGIAFIIEYLKF